MNFELFPAAPQMIQVDPVVDHSVRGLCVRPYPLHPKGCPNFGKCDRCPPKAPFFEEAFDLALPVFAVVNQFDLAAHVARMAARNPDWSDRQLRCVLYWQGTARKQLQEKIQTALAGLPGYVATWCPEGMGVNVTATMQAIGVPMEWPPVNVAMQVALLGFPRGRRP